MAHHDREAGQATRRVDVAIAGAGLAGSTLAACLTSDGLSVALCEARPTHTADFRAEKLSRGQFEAFSRCGLADVVRRAATPIDSLWIARRGILVECRRNREMGVDYAALVNAIRASLPDTCQHLGRVSTVETSAQSQVLHLAGGTRIDARILVVATGLGGSLLRNLGIERSIVAGDPCLAIGFDITTERPAPFASLTYFGERFGDRAAYLTVFPIGDRLRANLFVFRRHDEAWSRAFRADPGEALLALMPGLRAIVPGLTIVGPVAPRPIELYVSAGHLRAGLVLAGDAFRTACPTGGTGVDKVLTDVERLRALIPDWLATDGFGLDKVAQFYGDPAKQACDARSRRRGDYARAMALDPGLAWSARRTGIFHAQRLRGWTIERWRREQAEVLAGPVSG